jgi:hypothetical protein
VLGAESSVGTSWPAGKPKPPPGVNTLAHRLTSTLLIPGQLSLLTQADLEKYEQQSSAKSNGYQDDGEHLASQSADYDARRSTCQYEHGG